MSKIKNIQLIEIEPTEVLAVVVTDGNSIRDYIIRLEQKVNQQLLNTIASSMNQYLYNLTLTEIGLDKLNLIKSKHSDNEEVISKVIDVVFKTIQVVDESDIFTYGTTNILQFPEFNDISKASSLIKALEAKDVLKDIINTTIESDDGSVKIVIGAENVIEDFKECSLITTSYHIGGEKVGAIGIIGPKRMDYDKTVQNLRCLIKSVDELLNKL
jgi:heat-inducible transcriptional repressor